MISKTGEAESITSHYLFCLGGYRALYIINWLYRFYSEGFFDLIAIVAGCVQTILYCDFFYLYITKGKVRGPTVQATTEIFIFTLVYMGNLDYLFNHVLVKTSKNQKLLSEMLENL